MRPAEAPGRRRFALSFKGDLEGEFLDLFFEHSIAQMRFALGLAVVLYSLFGLLDAIAAPAQKTQLWTIRFVIVTPIIIVIWALSFRRSFRRYAQAALMMMVLAAGVGIIAMTVVADAPAKYLYHAGLILVLMFAFTFVRLRFVNSFVVCMAIVAIYLATTAIVGATPMWIIVNNAFFLVTAIIIGAFACYSLELYERRNFLQTREIASSTEDLQRKNEKLLRTNADLIESRQLVIESSRRAQLIFSALADALPGTDLENKYRLEEKIGSGGFGTVYRARHLLLDAPVAVKIFRPVVGMNLEKSFERFRLEGISGKRIAHPNAVAVLDFGIASSAIAFLVMELLEGHTLAEEMRTVGKLPPRRCGEIAIPICSVLAEAHGNGIIHRDIKPSNIFLHQTRTGEVVKVVDFGIAKLLESSTTGDLEQLTATGILIGTPSYMAPERLASKCYGPSSDIYSVGVLLYQMLTGHVPHETALAHMTEPVKRPDDECDVPAAFSDIVVRAMSIDPGARPTAVEMACMTADIFGVTIPVSTLPGDVRIAHTSVDLDAPTDVQDPSKARTVMQRGSE